MDVANDAGAGEKRSRIQEQNRKLILAAALEVFSAYGFRGATIDQIAEKAGMSKPNLLYYYRKKQDIYAEVLRETLSGWLQPFEDIDPDGDPIEEISRYIRAKLEMSRTMPEASRLFANEILHGAPVVGAFLEQELPQVVSAKADVVARWAEEGQIAPIDPRHLFFMIWAITQHYADFDIQVRSVLGIAPDAADHWPDVEKAVIGLVLNGISPRPQG